jgi:hypothetical protein
VCTPIAASLASLVMSSASPPADADASRTAERAVQLGSLPLSGSLRQARQDPRSVAFEFIVELLFLRHMGGRRTRATPLRRTPNPALPGRSSKGPVFEARSLL